ncbi:MAG: disulfide bond formation protein B [Aestuariivirgaceae bacterium]
MSGKIMLALNQFDNRRATLAVFVISLATILGAWGFELIGGYWPCPLCLMQRWAYYAVVPLSLVLLVAASPARQQLLRWGLILCGLIVLANAGLGAYHSGVEWKFWPGPASCAGGTGLSGGLPDLSKARAVSCDDAQWRFAGLSFAGWNVVVSLMIAAAAFYGARTRYGSSSVSQ